MSTWRAKALEFLPEFRERIQAAGDRLDLWREIEREFHAGLRRGDDELVAHLLRYAVWTLRPTPQAKTLADVSASAARLLHQHADQLHRWLDRQHFLPAQKGLRLHLGNELYAEFETRFFEKTSGYPRQRRSNPQGRANERQPDRSEVNRTSAAAGCRRSP